MVCVKFYKSKNVQTFMLFKILQKNRLKIYHFNGWNGDDDHVVQYWISFLGDLLGWLMVPMS